MRSFAGRARPLRYFLAKEAAGRMLVVAERIDEIRRCLEEERLLRMILFGEGEPPVECPV